MGRAGIVAVASGAAISVLALVLAMTSSANVILSAAVDVPQCSGTGLSRARGLDPNASLVAAYVSNAATVANWQRTRLGPAAGTPPSRWSARSATEPVAVCYYNGTFVGIPMGPQNPTGTPKPNYDQVILEIGADGVPVFDAAGHRSTLPAFTP